ncbi:MAG: hypothetical protein U5L96_02765 [Owenweeksia sp.]|nr:hypothetical protein [Owenweeksia sp.]
MPEVYLIRCILDTEEDVIRDIAIEANASLMSMHHAVVAAFGLNKGEMSSFFKSNENWEQGEEISMMDYDPMQQKNPLETTPLKTPLAGKGSRVLFAYDFLNLWTFYMEVMEVQEVNPEKKYPLLVGKTGDTPAEAPDRQMKADVEDFDEESDDDHYSPDDWY